MNAHDPAAVASQFGVDHEQVERDHLISFMLAAISEEIGTEDVVLFGGTTLARTHLTDVRLSEDIDLLARSSRSGVAEALERASRRLRRSHGRITWIPPLTQTKGSQPAVMQVDDGPVSRFNC